MSTATEPATGPKALVPPEESLWKRYSPHHEAPLSGISSVALHLLALGGIAMIALIDTKCNDPDELDLQKRSANADNVKIVPIAPPVKVRDGGGGGNRDGKDKNPGGDPTHPDDKIESGDRGKKDASPIDKPPMDLPNLTPAQQKVLKDYSNDSQVVKLIESGNQQFRALQSLEQETRQALRKQVNPGGGGGGIGQDGGRDSGKDRGTGPGEGPGKGQELSLREKRMLRWAMTFNTENGQDYRRQLQGLGAILAFPVQGQSSNFLLIRNLNDPKAGKVEDIASLNRIFWVDDKQSSVRSLCNALGMPPPEYFAAFFPEKLETRLLEVELAYMKATYGKANEDMIHETRFDVLNLGGNYDVKVRGMSLNR